ncbi:MAG: cation:proton antiporter, partial [Gammaproteobacteria bacterium]|nr:cation:proton antiporter [Gammaproteobacteria bacterium]
MEVAAWGLVVGGLLVLMALSSSSLKDLPLSTAMIYLLVGLAIGPLWLELARIDPVADAKLVEHLTEFVVVVSLFSVGLKLSVELDDRRWLLPLRLAVGSMVLTVGLIALAGV